MNQCVNMANTTLQRDSSPSILAGSDEMFDFFCQPCSTEIIHTEAVGYCQDCCEYLCDNCYTAHRKLTATKHHKMLDTSAMPKLKLQPKSTDILKDTCLKHPGKVLEYFCNDHSELCCGVCVNMQHRSCLDMSYVPEVSIGIANSHEYKRLKEELDRLLAKASYQNRKINDKSQTNNHYKSKALADIRKFRQQINELLDKLEDETTKKISELNRKNEEKIKLESDTYQSVVTDVKSMTTSLEENATSGKDNQLFIEMKMTKVRLHDLEAKSKAVDGQLLQYSFLPDQKIQQLLSTLATTWSLSVMEDNTPTAAKYVRKVSVKSGEDTRACFISGIVALTGNRMAVTDYNNYIVKLIDIKRNKLISCLSVSSGPRALTEINPNQVAVSLGYQSKIEIITVSDGLTRTHTISTPGLNIAEFCCDGSKFIALIEDPASVKIIDMTGCTLNTFTADNNGMGLFTIPNCVAISRDKDLVYVTDAAAENVTSITVDGHVISIYRHDMLKFPFGVAVGKDGSVYVCSKDTRTIHQLSPTGDIGRVILREKLGFHNVAYGDDDDILYISSLSTSTEKCNYIRLYQLE